MKDHKSHYDPTRDTVGKIYRDLHMQNSITPIEVGDMTNSMLPGLVDDINDTIREGAKDFEGRPFYIQIHEKKDLQMKDALLRRMIKREKRPWPEDDTTVFWHDPKAVETRFCWSLPHWSEMINILNNRDLFDPNLIQEIIAWREFKLEFFGFIKDEMGNWQPNPKWKDKPLGKEKITV